MAQVAHTACQQGLHKWSPWVPLYSAGLKDVKKAAGLTEPEAEVFWKCSWDHVVTAAPWLGHK